MRKTLGFLMFAVVNVALYGQQGERFDGRPVYVGNNPYAESQSLNTPNVAGRYKYYPTRYMGDEFYIRQYAPGEPKAEIPAFGTRRAALTDNALDAASARGVIEDTHNEYQRLVAKFSPSPHVSAMLREAGFEQIVHIRFKNQINREDFAYWFIIFQNDRSIKAVHLSPLMFADPIIPRSDSNTLIAPQVSLEEIDPFEKDQYGPRLMKAFETQNGYGFGRRNVHAVVVDSGACDQHPDKPRFMTLMWDAIANIPGGRDEFGHGCHVAGIIAANPFNGIGIRGIAPDVSVWSIKVLGAQGSGLVETVADGIVFGAMRAEEVMRSDPKARFLFNLSLGAIGSSSILESSIKFTQKVGAKVFAAAGNFASNIDEVSVIPCVYDGVFCVGASDQNDHVTVFSNWGKRVFNFGPGDNIISTVTKNSALAIGDSEYRRLSGTSMATPAVLAGVGLAMSVFPDDKLNTNEQIEVLLDGSGDSMPGKFVNYSESGRRANILEMVNAARTNPQSVELLSSPRATHSSSNLRFWLSSGDDGKPVAGFEIFYSDKPFNSQMLGLPQVKRLVIRTRESHKWVDVSVPSLLENTVYYYTLRVFDRNSNFSELFPVQSFRTSEALLKREYAFTKSNGTADPGSWRVIEGPFAQFFRDFFLTPDEGLLFWKLTNKTLDQNNSTFYWTVTDPKENGSINYEADLPFDVIVISEIFDFTGTKGASMGLDLFSHILRTPESINDAFEIHAIPLDSSNRPIVGRNTLIARYNHTNNSRTFMEKISLDLSSFEGQRFYLAFRFFSPTAGLGGGIGVYWGNLKIFVDKDQPRSLP